MAVKGVKQQRVCKGCEYYRERLTTMPLRGICGYMDATGKSRLKVEMENGGYKEDSCVCYKKKTKKGRPRKTEQQKEVPQ